MLEGVLQFRFGDLQQMLITEQLAIFFGVSQASVCDIINEFCTAVSDVLLPKFIKVPVSSKYHDIKKFKDKWGFPQCVGAIDGSHIPIKALTEFHADYQNRKGWYSIILQEVVDSSYKFIDINVCL